MKVLMVTTSMSVGGVQSVVKSLANEVSARGHEVSIVSIYGDDTVETAPAVQRWSFSLPLGWQSRIRAIARLRRLIKETQPDVIHSHAFHANTYSWLALRSTRARNVRLITTVHSVVEGSSFHHFISRMTKWGSTSTAVSQAVSDSHLMELSSQQIVTNGIELERFAFDSAARSTVRKSLGVSEQCTVIVNVGRLTPAKDHALLLEAFSFLTSNYPGFHLLIVGDGPDQAAIERRIREVDMPNVTMWGRSNDVASILSAGDIYLSTSAWEGFPVGLIEAKASGLPIVATDVGGTREVLGDIDWLVAGRSPETIASAVLSAAGDQQSRQARSRHSSTLRLSASGMTDRWIRLYERSS